MTPPPRLGRSGPLPFHHRFGAWCEQHPTLLLNLVALAWAIPLVLLSQPVLSDDIWRYIHDGQTLLAGENPYQTPPAEVAPRDDTHAALLKRINHPHLVTIYQPASQYAFAGLAWTAERIPADRLGDHTFRLGMVAFHLLTIGLLVHGLRQAGRSPWWATLYAWHPLAISEIAGAGHQDVIGIAALVAALVVVSQDNDAAARNSVADTRNDRRGSGRAAVGGLCLALAVAVKPVVLPVGLALAWHLRQKPAAAVTGCITTATTLAALYLPLALMDGGLGGMVQTGQVFLTKWAFNGSLAQLLAWGLGRPSIPGTWSAAGATAVMLACLAMRAGLVRSVAAYLLALLLLSSTVHPWYVLWPLALLPLAFSPTVAVLSLTVGWSYLALWRPGYDLPVWLLLAEYVPVWLAAAWEVSRGRSPRPLLSWGRSGKPTGEH